MNCKQVDIQIDRYLDNRLEHGVNRDILKHFMECEECNNLMSEKKELNGLINESATRIPSNMVDTDRIMRKIYKLQSERENERAHKAEGVFFRRLGVSMILAAFIMLFSLLQPFGRTNMYDASVREELDRKEKNQMDIGGAFSKLDDRIKSLIDSIDFNFKK